MFWEQMFSKVLSRARNPSFCCCFSAIFVVLLPCCFLGCSLVGPFFASFLLPPAGFRSLLGGCSLSRSLSTSLSTSKLIDIRTCQHLKIWSTGWRHITSRACPWRPRQGWWTLPGYCKAVKPSSSLKPFFSKKTKRSIVQFQVFFLFKRSFLAKFATWSFKKHSGLSELLIFRLRHSTKKVNNIQTGFAPERLWRCYIIKINKVWKHLENFNYFIQNTSKQVN